MKITKEFINYPALNKFPGAALRPICDDSRRSEDSDLNGLSPAMRDEFSGHPEQALEASKGAARERGKSVQCRVAVNPISNITDDASSILNEN